MKATDVHGAIIALSEYPVIGVDIETTALHPADGRIRSIQLAVGGDRAVVIDCDAVAIADFADELSALFDRRKKIAHNAAFEAMWLEANGVHFRRPLFDTMIAAQLLTCGHKHPANLKACVERYLGEQLPKDEQTSFDCDEPLSPSQLEYAARDAAVLIDLRSILVPKLIDAGLVETAKIEMDAVPAFAQMSRVGLRFDWQRIEGEILPELRRLADENLAALWVTLDRAGAIVPRDLFGNIGVNPGSTQQMTPVIASATGLKLEKLDAKYLALQTDPTGVIDAYLAWKSSDTAVRDAEKYLKHRNPNTDRAHSNFRQLGADSGRVSSSTPNVQNLPRGVDFRSVVVPAPGRKLVVADYSQIELRIAAQVSGDRRMTEAYRNDEDLHKLTAALVNGIDISAVTKAQRQAAKAVNFGLVYGQGASGLKNYAKQSYGVTMTEDEAKRFRDRYFKSYRGIASWHRKVDPKNGGNNAYLYTASGRRRWLSPVLRKLTIAANTPVQGLGADILKLALGNLVESLDGIDAAIVNTVHDEIVIECDEAIADDIAALLSRTMVTAAQRFITDLPVEADSAIGDSWAEAK